MPLVALSTSLLLSPAFGLSQPMTKSQVCANASAAVVGVVQSVSPQAAPNRKPDIVSVVTFQVEKVVSGAVPQNVSFLLRGGTLNGRKVWSSVETQMKEGERYFLILADHPTKPNYPYPVRLSTNLIDDSIIVPPETVLQAVWQEQCEGVANNASSQFEDAAPAWLIDWAQQ